MQIIDTVLKRLCPHDPASRQTAPDAAGRILTTCSTCGVSWFEHGDDAAGALEAVYVAHFAAPVAARRLGRQPHDRFAPRRGCTKASKRSRA